MLIEALDDPLMIFTICISLVGLLFIVLYTVFTASRMYDVMDDKELMDATE